MLKAGAEGCYVAGADVLIYHPGFEVKLVDTVGAGTPVDEPGGLPPDLIQDIQRISTPFSGFRHSKQVAQR